MSKSLSHILVVFKVARILAKISFILCIIGAVGALFGCFILPVAYRLASDVIVAEGITLYVAYCAFVAIAFAAVGSAIFAVLAQRYFNNVLRVGTPFTAGGARECFRLGIASLIISVSEAVATAITLFVVRLFISSPAAEDGFSVSVSLSTGLIFLFLSMLFKHGAELRDAAEEKAAEEKTEEAL